MAGDHSQAGKRRVEFFKSEGSDPVEFGVCFALGESPEALTDLIEGGRCLLAEAAILAAPRPAVSISTGPGMPTSLMAMRSYS